MLIRVPYRPKSIPDTLRVQSNEQSFSLTHKSVCVPKLVSFVTDRSSAVPDILQSMHSGYVLPPSPHRAYHTPFPELLSLYGTTSYVPVLAIVNENGPLQIIPTCRQRSNDRNTFRFVKDDTNGKVISFENQTSKDQHFQILQ